MEHAEWALVWLGVATIIVTLYGFYVQIRQRAADKVDEAQAKQIKDLQDTHDKDRLEDQTLNDKNRVEDRTYNDKAHTVIFKRLDENHDATVALQIEMAVVKQTNLNTDRMLAGFNIGVKELGGKIDELRTELTSDIKNLGLTLNDHINHEERIKR